VNKREALRLQKQAGLARVLADARASVARIMAAVPVRPAYVRAPPTRGPTEEARFAVRQLARDAARYADELELLPAILAEVWDAAANLMAALESVETELTSTDPWLVEARHLMGAAAAHIAAAGQAAKQRAVAAQHGSGGGRPSKAGRDAELAGRFAERQRSHRTLTTRELYDDIAAEFGVEWWTVRDAVLKATPAG